MGHLKWLKQSWMFLKIAILKIFERLLEKHPWKNLFYENLKMHSFQLS